MVTLSFQVLSGLSDLIEQVVGSFFGVGEQESNIKGTKLKPKGIKNPVNLIF